MSPRKPRSLQISLKGWHKTNVRQYSAGSTLKIGVKQPPAKVRFCSRRDYLFQRSANRPRVTAVIPGLRYTGAYQAGRLILATGGAVRKPQGPCK